jgi:hypothetical protein
MTWRGKFCAQKIEKEFDVRAKEIFDSSDSGQADEINNFSNKNFSFSLPSLHPISPCPGFQGAESGYLAFFPLPFPFAFPLALAEPSP